MATVKSIAGQWVGHFVLGPEYGRNYGEKGQFRFFLKDLCDGHLEGEGVDVEGAAIDFDVSTIFGFQDGHFIRFKKVYSKRFYIDEAGNRLTIDNPLSTEINYEGYFNSATNNISGTWQIEAFVEQVGDHIVQHLLTGKWEMRQDHE